MRHGPTPFNDPAHETLRGWTDIGLAPEARPLIAKTAQALQTAGITHIVHSDLERARDTAAQMAEHLGIKQLWPTMGLRPWNSGELAGQPVAVYKPELIFYARHPNLAPQSGETFNTFLARWNQMLNWLQAKAVQLPHYKILAVTHSRNLYSLAHLLTRGRAPIAVSGPPYPAEAVKFSQTPSGTFQVEPLPPLKGETNGPSRYRRA